LTDPLDLGFEGVNNQGVDAGARDPGDGFGIVGEFFRESDGGLPDVLRVRHRIVGAV
jgi:hypothetical protein